MHNIHASTVEVLLMTGAMRGQFAQQDNGVARLPFMGDSAVCSAMSASHHKRTLQRRFGAGRR
jgi:hypothetical protein